MSRGRHSLPEPPRSPLPLVLVGLVLVIAAVGAVWLIDDSWVVEVGVTAVLVALAGADLRSSVRSSHQITTALWHEATRDGMRLPTSHRELNQLRAQHVELLLELRSLRVELTAASEGDGEKHSGCHR